MSLSIAIANSVFAEWRITEIIWQQVPGCRTCNRKRLTPDDRTWCDSVVARWADGDLQSGAAYDWQH